MACTVSFPLEDPLARTSYFAGCRRGSLAQRATQLCCNVCLVFFVSMELLRALEWEPLQPTDGPHAYVASRGWIASYWRNPAISFCHMQQIAMHQTLQQEWQRHLRQVDGHLGGECRTVGGGTALGLTLDSCLTKRHQPAHLQGEATLIW